MPNKELEIAYLKAKYKGEGLDIRYIDWDLAIEYEKQKQLLCQITTKTIR